MRNKNSTYILKNANMLRLIKLLGGCCKKCSKYDPAIMCFHHTDPKTKEYNINELTSYRYSRLVNEAEKCELLCCNCHSEIHSNIEKLTTYSLTKMKLLNMIDKHSCEHCGYDKNINALIFHHIDPNEKDFNIAKRLGACKLSIPQSIINEVSKCLVLCVNCHRKVHFDYYKYNNNLELITKKSNICDQELREKIKADDAKIIELYNLGHSNKNIANTLNCAESTVSQILKKHGISKLKDKMQFSEQQLKLIECEYLKDTPMKVISKMVGKNNSSSLTAIFKTLHIKYGKSETLFRKRKPKTIMDRSPNGLAPLS